MRRVQFSRSSSLSKVFLNSFGRISSCRLLDPIHKHTSSHASSLGRHASSTSTKPPPKPPSHPKGGKTPPEPPPHSTQLKLSDAAEALVKANKSKLTSKGSTHCTSIMEQPAISAMMDAVLGDLAPDDHLVVMDPWPGGLTRQLLDRTPSTNKLVLFEPRVELHPDLRTLVSKDEDRVTLSYFDFNYFYYYYVMSRRKHDQVSAEFIRLLPEQENPDRSNVRILGSVRNPDFVSKLLMSLVLDISVYENRNPTFYLFMPDQMSKRFFSQFPFQYNTYFRFSLPFNYFFDTKIVDEVSCANFYPLLKVKKPPGIHNIDSTVFQLVKIEPKMSFLREFSVEERQNFLFFLRLITRRSTSNLLIDNLSNWFKGFSTDFIDAGFRVYSYAPEMTREDILFLYNLVSDQSSDSMFQLKRNAWFQRRLGWHLDQDREPPAGSLEAHMEGGGRPETIESSVDTSPQRVL